jgi:hypothetical protein
MTIFMIKLFLAFLQLHVLDKGRQIAVRLTRTRFGIRCCIGVFKSKQDEDGNQVIYSAYPKVSLTTAALESLLMALPKLIKERKKMESLQ